MTGFWQFRYLVILCHQLTTVSLSHKEPPPRGLGSAQRGLRQHPCSTCRPVASPVTPIDTPDHTASILAPANSLREGVAQPHFGSHGAANPDIDCWTWTRDAPLRRPLRRAVQLPADGSGQGGLLERTRHSAAPHRLVGDVCRDATSCLDTDGIPRWPTRSRAITGLNYHVLDRRYAGSQGASRDG